MMLKKETGKIKDVLKISEYVGYLNVVVFVPDERYPVR